MPTDDRGDAEARLPFIVNLVVNKSSEVFQYFRQIRIHKSGIITWNKES